jgi:hypothetical protein
VFIPLWPKIPLFQIIPGYIVRVRLEDLAVGLTGVVFLVQLLRQKVSFLTPLTKWMALYLSVGFLSLLSALFLIHTIPILPLHAAKAFLHLARYAEYFALFFFVFWSVREKKHVKWFVIAMCLVVVGTALYGLGQKYWQWPVYSTMNYAFSSGEPLELINPQSRVQSTFAGHYDFAIYLDLALPLLLGLMYTRQHRREQLVLALVFALGLWGLIVSGLRSAFLSYVIMATFLTFLFALRQKNLRQKISWFVTRLFLVGTFTGVMFGVFGNNLFALLSHAAAGLFSPTAKTQTIDQTIISQYQLPVPKDQVEQYKKEGGTKPEQLSGCALQKEVSLCIRLESLWPQAVTGFRRMPILGSGYASLNKRDFNHLSEADGTDNNYLRILGETGLAGFLSFSAILFVTGKLAVKNIRTTLTQPKKLEQFALGAIFITLLIGILLNAFLIDVFAASKVAFGFWAITGLFFAAQKIFFSKK